MKPRLLLHICCAPDEAWVIHTLRESYDLRCFFCNPNIQPEAEHEKRRAEAKRAAGLFSVPFDADDYAPFAWENAIEDFSDTPEGGARCGQCFLLRLRQTAKFCASIQWPSFASVMSVSPHKKIDMIDGAGLAAAKEYGVIFAPFNFKKNNGFLGSVRLSKELGLYRQDYCGCRLSGAESERRKKQKEESKIHLLKKYNVSIPSFAS
jgi:predicted adenine nucleotide alpha hydrolase (AANH) superfamily ATPase